MIVHNVRQGSAEWIALRLGIATASNFHKIITPAKGDLSEQRHAYMYQLVVETLTGVSSETTVTTEHMEN